MLVVEQVDRVGGAVHTAETIREAPGFRFDTCSVVHNLINMTSIPEELRLREVGLEYVETDPFIAAFLPDGTCIRFYRSVERTCEEIARFSKHDARAYAEFIALADPIAELSLAAFRTSADERSLARIGSHAARQAVRLLRRSPGLIQLIEALAGPYSPLLEARFDTAHARMGLVPLVAHGSLGPQTPGAARPIRSVH